MNVHGNFKKLASHLLLRKIFVFVNSYKLVFFFYHIENGDMKVKTAALKKVMYQILNGEKMPSLLMTIIRFILPLQDHQIKKLLLIFWEIVPKTGADGKLLHEMILVCDAYRRDLEHPNEFIRGSTLRFLCKLKVGFYHDILDTVFIFINN